ncbi:hypothetical protein JCM10207_005991 [Rhodosporidiobolus poonsookiae]
MTTLLDFVTDSLRLEPSPVSIPTPPGVASSPSADSTTSPHQGFSDGSAVPTHVQHVPALAEHVRASFLASLRDALDEVGKTDEVLRDDDAIVLRRALDGWSRPLDVYSAGEIRGSWSSHAGRTVEDLVRLLDRALSYPPRDGLVRLSIQRDVPVGNNGEGDVRVDLAYVEGRRIKFLGAVKSPEASARPAETGHHPVTGGVFFYVFTRTAEVVSRVFAETAASSSLLLNETVPVEAEPMVHHPEQKKVSDHLWRFVYPDHAELGALLVSESSSEDIYALLSPRPLSAAPTPIPLSATLPSPPPEPALEPPSLPAPSLRLTTLIATGLSSRVWRCTLNGHRVIVKISRRERASDLSHEASLLFSVPLLREVAVSALGVLRVEEVDGKSVWESDEDGQARRERGKVVLIMEDGGQSPRDWFELTVEQRIHLLVSLFRLHLDAEILHGDVCPRNAVVHPTSPDDALGSPPPRWIDFGHAKPAHHCPGRGCRELEDAMRDMGIDGGDELFVEELRGAGVRW